MPLYFIILILVASLFNDEFGSDFFNNKNITETPELFIATPSDYRLGPGDELMINLYGASENTYSVQISRNGTLSLHDNNNKNYWKI